MKRLVLLSVSLIFSLLSATAQNKVAVKQDAEKIEYNPMIFGAFLEHFDNQVYGGIFCPGSPLSDEDGFRTDVIDAVREMRVPIVRWPGGCFVSAYHWKDGVGPDRQSVWAKAWQVEDPNTFGTDEFVKWCRKAGCEPYICTNAGTGTMEEMSDTMRQLTSSLNEIDELIRLSTEDFGGIVEKINEGTGFSENIHSDATKIGDDAFSE